MKRARVTSVVGTVLMLCLASGAATDPRLMSVTEVLGDLDQFQEELHGRAAYVTFGAPDYVRAIEAIRARARTSGGMTVYAFGIEIDKVLALTIDCHSLARYGVPAGFLPFWLEPTRGRFVAHLADRSAFFDPEYPYVTRIDGLTIDGWVNVLRAVIPKGSPQKVVATSVLYLHYIHHVRDIRGEPRSQTVVVELETRDGATRKTLVLPVLMNFEERSPWPATPSRILPENIGYLRITNWYEEAVEVIATWMPRFRSTRGLIVDLRDNNGGDRNIFLSLYPYLVKATDPPRVANVAKYRLYSGFRDDHLAGRHMYRWTWNGWTFLERLSIAKFMRTFEPEWQVPSGDFSDWHYWVLSKRLNPAAYDPPGPIVFLMNERCASGSDVALSAAKGLGGVTLIGRPSVGTSGAYVETTLRNSGIRIRLSSMASFQNTGQLYETHGVQPDIRMEVEPDFFLQGGPDAELAFAVRVVLGQAQSPSQTRRLAAPRRYPGPCPRDPRTR